MENKKALGKRGEDLACAYLTAKGYSILRRNYRIKIGEIDIIANHSGTIVFVEVKSRRCFSYGRDIESITDRKQRTIRKIAEYYYACLGNPQLKARIDAIDIVLRADGSLAELKHFENAF